MSTLIASPAVLPWLADLTLLATLWLGMLWAGMRCLPRLSAARRHVLLGAGLACLPVLMMGTLRAPMWNFPVLVAVRQEPEAAPKVEPRAILSIDSLVPMAGASLPETKDPAPRVGWREGVVLFWLAGIGVLLAALLVAAWRLRGLRLRSVAVTHEQTLALWHQACAEAGVAPGRARLREHSACAMPMTWGVRVPVVLLPTAAAAWPEERLRLVLRHELAHVCRHDVLLALVTGLMALPLWFHPLVWLIWRDAHEAREAACDDAALTRSGDQPDVFASQLLDAVTTSAGVPEWRLMPIALGMAGRNTAALRRRLGAILDHRRSRSLCPRWQAGGMAGALALGALMVSGLSACRKTGTAAVLTAQQVIISSKVLSIPLKSKTGRILASAFEGGTASGLQLRGVLDEKQAHELLSKLDEAKDEVRILSAPTVTTRSGQRATVEVIREFIYPTEFDPPVNEKGKPVTPATPTAFETRSVGVRIGLQPQVGEEGAIELEVSPEVTRFLGFVDYGSPIRSEVTGPDGQVSETLVTSNKIQQPIFHSMKTSTSVALLDGQFLVIGGLAEQKGENLDLTNTDVNKVADLAEGNVERLVYFIIQPKLKK